MSDTIEGIFKRTVARLEPIYGDREARSVVRRLFADGLGIDRKELIVNHQGTLSAATMVRLDAQILELEQMRPVQYVVGKEEFRGRSFRVNESVLIPRPETEELVSLIVNDSRDQGPLRVLDIGTGSGAIAISLALEMPGSRVEAWDISMPALDVARFNAQSLRADVNFKQVDILEVAERTFDYKWDIIVSNPPYVTESEKVQMHDNVLNFEPQMALFVDDNDPLIFYRAIARFARRNLNPVGRLYFEINEQFGNQTCELLGTDFENIYVKKDIHGRDRMISCNV